MGFGVTFLLFPTCCGSCFSRWRSRRPGEVLLLRSLLFSRSPPLVRACSTMAIGSGAVQPAGGFSCLASVLASRRPPPSCTCSTMALGSGNKLQVGGFSRVTFITSSCGREDTKLRSLWMSMAFASLHAKSLKFAAASALTSVTPSLPALARTLSTITCLPTDRTPVHSYVCRSSGSTCRVPVR